jgi:hypothetical protein
MALPLAGYPLTIWTAIRAALTYAAANINASDPTQTKALIMALAETLDNGQAALAAYQFSVGTQVNFEALVQVASLPLTLDPATKAALLNRIEAMQEAVLQAQALQVVPTVNPAVMVNGTPMIPDPKYLEFLLNFTGEAIPDGLTLTNLTAQAAANAQAWTTIAQALQTQGVNFTGTSLNEVQQMGRAASVVASILPNVQLASNANLLTVWNTLVAMPTIGRTASMTATDPTSLTAQAMAIARLVTLTALQKVNNLIVTMRASVVVGQPRLATVRRNDNLMDIASRELGNFEAWRDIATLNNLSPPYVANVKSLGVAGPGDQLFIPQPGATITSTGQAPNYLNNYLGVDLYLGPLNSDMAPWAGDFQVIGGYQNLSFSLGRRLQTPLEQLIYHLNFGSRIPPEIGSITDSRIAGVLEAYTESCLQSDPRVDKIVSVDVSIQRDNAFQIKSVVQPNGLGANDVTVNEVLGPI